ncbi:E3 ubiquitin-protein ligase KEG [Frankliniella fusca]|uniref:E3 ubiquitin-protein ligase KEG n=1 Tax=Frankliniella fusca TaxID=407009 RepID=A0AAE1HU16_9NEOP|nr:E3 ubiquitin-protein ligase KEG [Frankliniella fusca]
MECNICDDEYDENERVPKILPCGHTMCAHCEKFLYRVPRGWCRDCGAAAAARCWDVHEVLNAKAALRHRLAAGALQRAAGQLQDLQAECDGEQALAAVTLLAAESWELTMRSGARVLTGTLQVTEDPLIEALLLVAAARIALTEGEEGAQEASGGGEAGGQVIAAPKR